jgi:hypothetical protein
VKSIRIENGETATFRVAGGMICVSVEGQRARIKGDAIFSAAQLTVQPASSDVVYVELGNVRIMKPRDSRVEIEGCHGDEDNAHGSPG